MQSPYLVDKDVLYIGYDFIIGTSKADMNIRFDGSLSHNASKLVKANVPLNKPLPVRLLTINGMDS